MAKRARKTRREDSAAANGRHRSPPDSASGALVTPQDSQPEGQRPAVGDPLTGQDIPPKTITDLVWKVCKDKDAQDGFDRIMHTVTRSVALVLVLLTVPVVLLVTMPAPWPWKAIFSGGTTAVIAIISTIVHLLRKRRSGRLTAVRPIAGLPHPIPTAQDSDGGSSKQDRNRRKHGRYTCPYQNADAAGKCDRSPGTNRRGRNSSFCPIGSQRQPTAPTFRPVWLTVHVRRGQEGSRRLVSAHLARPVITEGRYEVAWSLQDTSLRTRRRNIFQSAPVNASVAPALS
jgi:hypothetical protein